jgi:hypothetical protein
MILAITIAIIAYFLNICFINKFAVLGAGIAMFLTEIILNFTNMVTGIKSLNYLNYNKIFKTFVTVSMISLSAFLFATIVFKNSDNITYIYKISTFLIINVLICAKFRRHILS